MGAPSRILNTKSSCFVDSDSLWVCLTPLFIPLVVIQQFVMSKHILTFLQKCWFVVVVVVVFFFVLCLFGFVPRESWKCMQAVMLLSNVHSHTIMSMLRHFARHSSLLSHCRVCVDRTRIHLQRNISFELLCFRAWLFVWRIAICIHRHRHHPIFSTVLPLAQHIQSFVWAKRCIRFVRSSDLTLRHVHLFYTEVNRNRSIL